MSMRDGATLAANVWRPVDGTAPTLLIRLPYSKTLEAPFGDTLPNFAVLLEAGYAIVVQDCRGTFRSEGDFVPHAAERTDGEDTIAWIAEQPWSDGTVGMFGPSYLGMVQWAAAVMKPPALKAIAPFFTSADPYRTPWYSNGGALSLSLVTLWGTSMYTADAKRALERGTGSVDQLLKLGGALLEPERLNDVLPTGDVPVLAEYGQWWSDFMAHPAHDEYWNQYDVSTEISQVSVPALHIGGWYDLFLGATVRAFVAARRHAGTEQARAEQRLVIGPWDHLSTDGIYPDRSFGARASARTLRLTNLQLKFFDRWVRGDTAALEDIAPVKIFVMGIDQWRDEQDWPLPDTRWTDYHLSSDGRANTSSGDGTLSTEPAPTADRDTYLYDPRRPVPTTGSASLPTTPGFGGPVDQRTVAGRDDVLCYTTPILEAPVEVIGPISVTLFVSSSAVDTDFTAKLIDVFPDGKAINLCDGILRARYRDGLEQEVPLEPGTIYEITIDLMATANVFLPGHRIRLDISSSNFPRYDRNTNTGGVIARESEVQMIPAVNHIHHGPEHRSRLVLPIIDRNESH
ncbi:CocE/NonD family hydrolase [Nocardia sp. alder85J]|uniref:CocE/NonD family hydrolase n=1 Tax=Nocardia sp. alder85J TaxID=2862949 RepID=UPI001CD5B8A7|nr:CocE/NonD family hydrolase [Nocardia sp. alder85J]MCX4095688.1 CocE/NonD family hydrolase [Nocardia sp. alder85J]